MKTWMKFFGLGLLFAVWFSLLIPWDRMPDPDALYHIAMAQQTMEIGPVSSFPWLDLTTLGTHYADQHFLLHVLQIPFLYFFDPLTASRVSSVFFAVLALLGISMVFYILQVRHFWLWPILLALSQPFCTRMVQGKASPLAVLFWFIGIGLFLKLLFDPKKSSWHSLLFFTFLGLLFALTHGGWIILPGSIILIFISAFVFRLPTTELGTGNSVYSSQIPDPRFQIRNLKRNFINVFVAITVGIVVGLFAHPGRAELFELLKIQVLRIGIATPWFLHMGMEWSPASLSSAIGMIAVFGLILLLCIPGLLFAFSKPILFLRLRQILSLALLVAVLFALSLKSIRFTEYFQPLLALWTALLAGLIDWPKLFVRLRMSDGRLGRLLLPAVVGVALFAVLANNVVSAYSSLHDSSRFLDGQYSQTVQAISDRASSGDRVYHSSWDEFPALFFLNRDLHYVSGLDPTFLYEASTTLALDYQDFAFYAASSTPDQLWRFVHDRINAQFILIDHDRWPKLNELAASDSRYKLLLEAEDSSAYQVVDAH